MSSWTKEDELELVTYQADLGRREFIAKNAGSMVAGAFVLTIVGIVTLIVLMV